VQENAFETVGDFPTLTAVSEIMFIRRKIVQTNTVRWRKQNWREQSFMTKQSACAAEWRQCNMASKK